MSIFLDMQEFWQYVKNVLELILKGKILMIDTHAHLQDEKYENAEAIINNALKSGVEQIVCASANLKTSKQAINLAEDYDCVFATVGVHPEDAGEWNGNTAKEVEKLAHCNKVVAIGEIGLDYYEFCSREQQKQAFIDQIKLANKLSLPVVVHTRDATQDTMQILKENMHLLKCGVCIHCFSMSVEILKEVISYGFVISLGGAITFKNARGLLDIVKACPIENLMLETDSPYMSPEPFRGRRNEPKNVEFVAQKIAELKNMKLSDVALQTTINAKKFFKLP